MASILARISVTVSCGWHICSSTCTSRTRCPTATLYAYTLLQPDAAARLGTVFPILGSPAGLAAEATVCAQLLQTVARGDNLALEDQLRTWAEELRHR
ncbi:hypothetical protein AB0K98_29715 [Streptomyces werraensis]|uniref:hypothetical protein n=1 Tax=Streptomyces werraensis TaxID=68284 RepID=UPI0034256E22